MARKTEVSVSYTKTQNVSITVRDGLISKVTIWTTGFSGKDTKRVQS